MTGQGTVDGYDDMLTMLLADQWARVSGLDRAAAVRRCLRKRRDETKCPTFYRLAKDMLKAPSSKVVEICDMTRAGMIAEGYLAPLPESDKQAVRYVVEA